MWVRQCEPTHRLVWFLNKMRDRLGSGRLTSRQITEIFAA